MFELVGSIVMLAMYLESGIAGSAMLISVLEPVTVPQIALLIEAPVSRLKFVRGTSRTWSSNAAVPIAEIWTPAASGAWLTVGLGEPLSVERCRRSVP